MTQRPDADAAGPHGHRADPRGGHPTSSGVARADDADPPLDRERRDRAAQRTRTRRRPEANLSAIITSAMDAIITLDEDQRIVLFNRAAEEMFGCTAAEAIGGSLDRFIPARFRGAHREHVSRFGRTEQTMRRMGALGEVIGVRATGEEFPIEASIACVHDPATQYTVVLRDVAERKRIEAALRERESLVRLGQMAAVVAHEVKNPLAGVQGVLQVLQRRPTLGARDREAIADVLDRLASLDHLLVDLLTYTKPPAAVLEPVDLLSLLRELIATTSFDPAFSRVEIDLTPSGREPHVRGDRRQLERLFSNLLLNAAQAMDGAGTIIVSVEEAPSARRVVVHDRGPGIPDDLRPRVFEPFLTTKHRGTGLGLAICQQIADQHGGTIALDCPPDGGTTVTVSLPA